MLAPILLITAARMQAKHATIFLALAFVLASGASAIPRFVFHKRIIYEHRQMASLAVSILRLRRIV